MNKAKKLFKNLITPGETLSQKVVKGGFWVFFLRIVNQGFSLIRLIVLARILSPKDFGLMGIALLTMSVLETFTQTGFQTALIQKKEEIKSYLDSAWTFLILRGFVLFIILYFIAPYAAVFFNTPEAKPIIRVIGFSIFFQAFTNIGITYFKKELEFNKEFIYQFTGTLADFIVAISAVLILRNVWALVLGLLAGNITRCFVSYLIHPYRPRLNFALEKVKELFGFGKWIFGSSILVFLITHGDDIFVGKLLGTTALGFYQMAYRISNMPATEITHVISQITFPAYSKLQDNIPKLREAYLKVLQLTAFLSFPIAGLIFILAPNFTKIFLGEKWLQMVPAMMVLALWGLIRSIGATTIIFQSVGKPEISTKLQFTRLILLVIIIYPLTIKWGILGASLAVLLSILPVEPITFYLTIKIIKCHIWEFGKLIIFPLIGAVIMSVAILTSKFYIFSSTGLFSFIVLIFIGGIVYVSMVIIFDWLYDYKIKGIIQNKLFFTRSNEER
ncbi:MAG TPA: lipopolysaccharide biosynthesis protein [Candidatus Atribacteria bacterium]|nr:lipopolysaccharide biosynthesis protein [Candidatus Atribacteria bacterium]